MPIINNISGICQNCKTKITDPDYAVIIQNSLTQADLGIYRTYYALSHENCDVNKEGINNAQYPIGGKSRPGSTYQARFNNITIQPSQDEGYFNISFDEVSHT